MRRLKTLALNRNITVSNHKFSVNVTKIIKEYNSNRFSYVFYKAKTYSTRFHSKIN